MHRVFGILVTSLWLVAMGELVHREVLPRWTAQDPPRIISRAANERFRRTQSGIYDARQRRVGTAWSVIQPTGEQFHLDSTVVLTDLASLPPLRIEMSVTLMGDGAVDEFDLALIGVRDVYGKSLKIEMRGESYGRYIPCTLQIGPFRRDFKLDAAASRLVCDGIRPFDLLRNLQVGQSWRMQMLDPISAALNQRATVSSVIAKVERKETITHDGRPTECFLVVAGRTRAWVAPDGRVLVQEADVPGVGRLAVRDEKYDEDQRHEAKKRVVEKD
jgi:hypothetical protein